MLEYDSRSLASAAVSAVLVMLLTIPSISAIASHFRDPKVKSDLYEDQDGVASVNSMAAFSVRLPKKLLSISSILGLTTAIPLAVLGTLHRDTDPVFTENWLNVIQWVCVHT